MICPSEDQTRDAILALLPRGRAWQTHEGRPDTTSTIYRFWQAVAYAFWLVNSRLCALRAEFFCRTASETLPEWMVEYDLPNDCEPYPELCDKVNAIGDGRCQTYIDIAARAGWDIECLDNAQACGNFIGDFSLGEDMPGNVSQAGEIIILVHTATSPSFTGTYSGAPFVGDMYAGETLDCDPDVAALMCILDRVIHAHVTVRYEYAA